MLYTMYMWAVIVTAVLFFGSAMIIVSPVAQWGGVYKLILHGWGKAIVALSGVKVTVTGLERLDVNAPYVFMSNHQSYFDVICLAARLDHPVRFVAKRELLYVPIFGLATWASGQIVINRSAHDTAVAELKKAAAKIRGGTSILVFPEGTRSGDHRLGPLKKGGFMLALEAQVPLVPVSITGTHPMMPQGGYTFAKSDVTITIGEPISTTGLSHDDRDLLLGRTRKAIIAGFPPGTPEGEANRSEAGEGRRKQTAGF